MGKILVPISVGELIDKMTILEIKSERIAEPSKLDHINKELELLRRTWEDSPYSAHDIDAHRAELKRINEALWEIEDYIRIKESEGAFDEQFIELARSVYVENDKRSLVKRRINTETGSELIEEKSYPDYEGP